MKNLPIFRKLLLIITALTLVSCTSKITQSNYEKIKVGMTMQEVVNILGKPNTTTSITLGDLTGTSGTWEDRNGAISIQFFNNAVRIKNYNRGVLRKETPSEQENIL